MAGPLGVCRRGGTIGDRCGEISSADPGFVGCEGGTQCAPTTCDRWMPLLGELPPPLPTEPGSGGVPGRCIPQAREGELCDSDVRTSPFELTCARCEPGTYCMEGEAVGPAGRRCFRPCDDGTGNPDVGLCACGDASMCINFPTEVLDDDENTYGTQRTFSGEFRPEYHCQPCLSFGQRDCDQADSYGCCEDDACEETFLDLGTSFDEQTLCCRSEGEDCASGPNGGCCPGTQCSNTGECEVCGVSGMDANDFVCCEGYHAVEVSEGVHECRRCGSVAQASVCSPYQFLTKSGSESDYFAIPPVDRRVPEVLGTSGGDLLNTFGLVDALRYRLHPRHRAYLFGDSLVNGSAGGAAYAPLPITSDPAVPLEFDLAFPFLEAVAARVYDIGACSLHLDWNRVANLVAIEMLKTDLDDSAESMTHRYTEVTPTLTHSPRFVDLPRGPSNSVDGFMVSSSFSVDPKPGCPWRDAIVNVTVDFALSAVDLQPPTDQALSTLLLGNNALSGVRCRLRGLPYAEYVCHLPNPAGGTNLVEHVIAGFPTCDAPCHVNDLPFAWAEHRWRDVGCLAEDERFVCSVPAPLDALPDGRFAIASSDPNVPLTQFSIPRARVYDPYDRAVSLRVLDVSVSVPAGECAAATVFGNRAENRIRRAVRRNLDQVQDQLAAAVSSGLPDGVALRRLLVRPEGIEVVLAENESDPQYDEVLGRAGSTSGAFLWRLVSCDDNREPVFNPLNPADTDWAEPLVSRAGDEPLEPSLEGEALCRDKRDTLCSGICREEGIVCSDGGLAFLLNGVDLGLSTNATCANNRCCNPDSVCWSDGRPYCSGEPYYVDGEWVTHCGSTCEVCPLAGFQCGATGCEPL